MPPRKRAEHGSPSGYYRHRRERAGEWGWPACEPCRKTHREEKQARERRPEFRKSARARQNAHRRATARLRVMYSQEFSRMYLQELSVVRDNGKTARAGLEKQIEQTLRAVRCTEPVLRQRCAAGEATPGEREVMRRVLALNRELIDLEHRCAQEKSRRAGK